MSALNTDVFHWIASRYAAAHAAVMMLIAWPCLRRLGVPMLLLALATGIGRVFVGVHFPLDIVAGFGLGLAMAETLCLAHAWIRSHTALPSETAMALQAGKEVHP